MGAPVVTDRRTALMTGCVLLGVGSWMIWLAYEARGRVRPFWVRFLPGA
ncbi:MAG: hypothetical protein J0I87_13845 [Cellulomonas sp.]|nr:hypothetical protein [Cellulomonas sp.]